MGYLSERERTSVSVRLGWNQEDYKEGGDLDRDTSRIDVNLRRDLSRSIFAELDLAYNVREYKYLARRDDDKSIRVTMGYRFGPAFNISLSYQFYQRESDVDGAGYDENRAFLRFTYVPAWGR